MNPSRYRFTPLLWLILLLAAFELLLRVPYLIWAASNSSIGYASRFQNFSIYNPNAVILSGALIAVMIVVTAYLAHRVAEVDFQKTAGATRLTGLGWATMAVAAFTLLAVALAIRELGLAAIAENISAKRDLDAMGAGAGLYIMLKVSLFSHVVATLFYMQYLGTRKKLVLALAAAFGLLTLVVSVIFSQRAMLFVLGFEIIYVTYIYGELNIRRLLAYAMPFGVILTSIGVFRSAAADNLNLSEAVLLGFDKLMVTRYFFNIAKMGSVFEWQYYSGLIDFLSFNFLVKPFDPDVIFFKDVGRIIGYEVFGSDSSGVTLGMVSEYILSFGVVIGTIFCFVSFFVIFRLERYMLASNRLPLITFFALAKIPVLLNTSLGSYVYQLVIESVLLIPIISGIKWSEALPARKR